MEQCEGKMKFIVTAKVKPEHEDSVEREFVDIAVEGVVVVLKAIVAAPHNFFAVICVENEEALQKYLDYLGKLGQESEGKVKEVSAKVVKRSVQNGWP